ncbi:Protein of unknown function [Pyronema omphalodes CBS 100304]|uniref:Uncharacterized protein n=1 Tax=Pyronema omphalodes (strain CBS 100304) TaxID=1076935 RepID=U4KW75_PYROM|nr:Protein of unknown function [Pyronema omphalodes CBS 100304]
MLIYSSLGKHRAADCMYLNSRAECLSAR